MAALSGVTKAQQSASMPASVYAFGSEGTAPEILPFDANLNAPKDCAGRSDRTVKLSLEIDLQLAAVNRADPDTVNWEQDLIP